MGWAIFLLFYLELQWSYFYKLEGPIPTNFCNSPFWNIRNLNDAVSEKKRMVIDSSYVISVHD